MIEIQERLAVADLQARSCPAPGRPSRGAARGVAAAVHAAGGGSPAAKKRCLSNGVLTSAMGPQDTDAEVSGAARKARRVSAGAGPSRSGRWTERPCAPLSSSLRESALLALVAGADRESAESEDDSLDFSCNACGLSCKSSRDLSEHIRKAHGSSTGVPVASGRRRKTASASPRSGSPCSDVFDSHDVGASSVRDHAAPSKGFVFKARAVGSAKKPGGRGPKRTASQAATAAGRTRPTNNQLLYKAYFRWQHYPYKVQGTAPLPTETEACASVTTAFLQVLSSLYEAESRREDSPRNVLQILSTNTRRTKVVELSSGTHRVPDELRKHCLTDSDEGEYSTNLDRNRYGSDNQYLNTVIQFDLDFLGLCPALVDVEIIDAKNEEKNVVIQADRALCNCGCGEDSHSGHDNVPVAEGSQKAEAAPVPNSGIFDMLLLAATGEASACSAGSSGDEDEAAGDEAASDENAHSHNSGQGWRDDEDSYPAEEADAKQPELRPWRQASAAALVRAGQPDNEEAVKLSGALAASQLRVAELEAQLSASLRKTNHSEEELVHSLEESEAKATNLQAEANQLRATQAEAEKTIASLKARLDKASASDSLQIRCSDLEAQLAAVARERDAHANAHSYYAVWVQQLQAEVTNLLKAAHNGNSTGVSPQLVALTQAVAPAQPSVAPVPSPLPVAAAPAAPVAQPLDPEAALRAQYEKQVHELLQQHLQGMQASQAAAAVSSFPAAQQLALHQLALPGVLGGGATGASALIGSPAGIPRALQPLEIAPLKIPASAAVKKEQVQPAETIHRSASAVSSKDTCPAPPAAAI